jgi:hypothetical protein
LAGLGAASFVWSSWAAILKATNNSAATAAGGVAASVMVALIGLALAYASRAQRQPAAG